MDKQEINALADDRRRRIRFGNPAATSVLQEAFDTLATALLCGYREQSGRTSRSMWLALESARDELAARGAVSAPQAAALKECLARDLTYLAGVIVCGPRRASDDLRRLVAKTRDPGAVKALLEVLELSGDGIYRVAAESRSNLLRRAGEVTCAGKIVCTQCRHTTGGTRSWLVGHCTECGCGTFLKAP